MVGCAVCGGGDEPHHEVTEWPGLVAIGTPKEGRSFRKSHEGQWPPRGEEVACTWQTRAIRLESPVKVNGPQRWGSDAHASKEGHLFGKSHEHEGQWPPRGGEVAHARQRRAVRSESSMKANGPRGPRGGEVARTRRRRAVCLVSPVKANGPPEVGKWRRHTEGGPFVRKVP